MLDIDTLYIIEISLYAAFLVLCVTWLVVITIYMPQLATQKLFFVFLIIASGLRVILFSLALSDAIDNLDSIWFTFLLNFPALFVYAAELLIIVRWAELTLLLSLEMNKETTSLLSSHHHHHHNGSGSSGSGGGGIEEGILGPSVVKPQLSASATAPAFTSVTASELKERTQKQRQVIRFRLMFFFWSVLLFLVVVLLAIYAGLYISHASPQTQNTAMVIYFPTVGFTSAIAFAICGFRLIWLHHGLRAEGFGSSPLTFVAVVCGVFFAIRASGDLVLDLYIYPGNDSGDISDEITNWSNLCILVITELVPAVLVVFAVGLLGNRKRRGNHPQSGNPSQIMRSGSSSSHIAGHYYSHHGHHHLHHHHHGAVPIRKDEGSVAGSNHASYTGSYRGLTGNLNGSVR
eukprot:ANDGO_03574.mRNA.1 hypothetical protein